MPLSIRFDDNMKVQKVLSMPRHESTKGTFYA